MQQIKKPWTRGILRAYTVRVYPSSLGDIFNYAKYSEEIHTGINPQAEGWNRPRPLCLANDQHHDYIIWYSCGPSPSGALLFKSPLLGLYTDEQSSEMATLANSFEQVASAEPCSGSSGARENRNRESCLKSV